MKTGGTPPPTFGPASNRGQARSNRGQARRHGIVWLASYPKSGNTWARMLLANILSRSHEPVPINALDRALPGSIAGGHSMFEHLVGLEASDLADDEADSLRPAAYRTQAERAARFGARLFHKVHDACLDTPAGQPLFPADATAGAVCLVRNPLDIAVSWTFYKGETDFAAAVRMLAKGAVIRGRNQFPHKLPSWSRHVESWTGAPFPVLAVRYEDLLADAAGQLAAMVRFLGMEADFDEERIRQAVSFSEFERLRADEAKNSFGEANRFAKTFFRSGSAGQWRRHLSSKQVADVVRANERVMKEWGYWDGTVPGPPT